MLQVKRANIPKNLTLTGPSRHPIRYSNLFVSLIFTVIVLVLNYVQLTPQIIIKAALVEYQKVQEPL